MNFEPFYFSSFVTATTASSAPRQCTDQRTGHLPVINIQVHDLC